MQVLSSVLLWNFALTNQLNKLPSKIQKDFVPTLINGKPSASTPLLVLCSVHALPLPLRPQSLSLSLLASAMSITCRVEVLGAGINGKLLCGASAIPRAVDVHLWTVLGWLPIIHFQHLGQECSIVGCSVRSISLNCSLTAQRSLPCLPYSLWRADRDTK